MTDAWDAQMKTLGSFIRSQRKLANLSLRQLAELTSLSNPYLSQIERGLRKPSAEVLQQLASALRVSTPLMYLRAGLLDAKEGQGVLAAIAADQDLTVAQKQSLTQIYQTFRRENERETVPPAGDTAADVAGAATDAAPRPAHAPTPEPKAVRTPAKKAVRKTARKAVPAATRRIHD